MKRLASSGFCSAAAAPSLYPAKQTTGFWGILALLCGFLAPNFMLTGGGWGDDNSVFAYIGWLMRRGYAPYRDVWDHKGPLLYYLNWFGWVITPQSTFGIGMLQGLAFAAAFFVLLLVLKDIARLAGIMIVVLLSIGFIAGTSSGANTTESWAVLPIAVAMATSFDAAVKGPSRRHFVLIATALTTSFWLRPDLALIPGLAGAICLYITARGDGFRRAAGLAATFSVTAALETGALLLPIWWQRTLPQLWEAYFLYNKDYGRTVLAAGRLANALRYSFFLVRQPLFLIGAAAWAALLSGFPRFRLRRSSVVPIEFQALLLVSFPLEMLACLAPGRLYPHYLLSLWPALMLLGGLIADRIIAAVKLCIIGPTLQKTAAVIAGAVIAGLAIQQGQMIVDSLRLAYSKPTEAIAVANYIDSVTTPTDRILPIGDGKAVQVALYARRLPAASYIYQLPIIHDANSHAVSERTVFLKGIETAKPKVIFSMPSPVGSLCRREVLDNAADEHDGQIYGYANGRLPKELDPILKHSYRSVADPTFKTACVYVFQGS